MKDFMHSPKPWTVSGPSIIDDVNDEVCNIAWTAKPDNITLIISAPDLLEALESLVETTERAKEKSIAFYGGGFYPCLKQAESAIKKAKGLE